MEYQKLIEQFNKIKIKKIGTTFLEIAKFPKRENVISNILAFFLDPKEEHHLDDLLLSSLLELVKANIPIHSKGDIFIYREFLAEGKRIDIVIQGNEFVLGIENKISADLYNDLDQYSKTLEETANKRLCFKIVLALKKEETRAGFISVTYADFFNKIESNLNKYIYSADSKFLLFLLDFMKTIIKPNPMKDNEELFNFFNNINNYEEGLKLSSALKIVEKQYKIRFWNEVAAKLESIQDGNWVIESPADIYADWSSLCISHKELKISVWIQSRTLANGIPYHGFSIDYGNLSAEQIKEYKEKDKSIANELLGEISNNPYNWVWLKTMPYNFGVEDIFKKIHPSKSKEHSDIIALNLWNIAKTIATNSDKFTINLNKE